MSSDCIKLIFGVFKKQFQKAGIKIERLVVFNLNNLNKM